MKLNEMTYVLLACRVTQEVVILFVMSVGSGRHLPPLIGLLVLELGSKFEF